MPLPPLSHHLPPPALRVLSRGRQLETLHADTRIVWHAWGDPEGEPLVLMHGGSGSWTHWLRNVEPIAATGRRVLVPDLPGFGDSDAGANVTDVDGMVEPMAQGLRELVGRDNLQVAGFSLGGLLAGLVAAAHPALIGHLVIAGSPGLGLRADDLKLKDWRHLPDKGDRDAVHRANIQTLLLHDPESIDDLVIRVHAANMDRDRLRQRKIARTDILARTLPLLTCRVDGIWGEFDQLYGSKMGELQALLRGMPNFGELVIVPAAGHWVQYEQSQHFNSTLLRLLEAARPG